MELKGCGFLIQKTYIYGGRERGKRIHVTFTRQIISEVDEIQGAEQNSLQEERLLSPDGRRRARPLKRKI